ncbi:TIGR03085 family metal-binding protein [Segeticoccus rhizosphaerae]|jgi:uncharacterized protein (TIGR03085 family)|uniref:TIGR03085 family metal-binding protein n=1 Tax=Segeticoccus rhizosphaerae TaxID=1104777 RepID=UPI0010C0501F|nr:MULTISPECIES: TIGR03085 family metal-binding protein [Intrasporangiaceae]
MAHLARLERQSLCDTFERVGRDAPTLCDPWLTRDLAAHLVIRDRRPDTVIGSAVPQAPVLGQHARRTQDSYAAQDWPHLVDLVRSGPPRWSPVSIAPLDEVVNLVEYFVHHEDVLRAGEAPVRRDLDPDLEAALWSTLTRMGRVLLRGCPVGVVAVTPQHGRRQLRSPRDQGSVVLRSSPGELVLLAFGRGRVAEVEVDGPPAAVAAFESSDLGL